jgi:hypothetical protein
MGQNRQKSSVDRSGGCDIPFPTDLVTIGQLRKSDPELFKSDRIQSSDLLELAVMPAVLWEQEIVAKARIASLTHTDPFPDVSFKHLIQMLNKEYCELGLSLGLQQTKQMVRDFVKAAEYLDKNR